MALAATDAYHFRGGPEEELALAQATVYHDYDPRGTCRSSTCRGAARSEMVYEPTEFGHEKTVKERIECWERLKREAGGS